VSPQTIVVTRPIEQAAQLIEAMRVQLQGTSAQIVSLPLLTIAPKEDAGLNAQIVGALRDVDLAIFVSPNAIECVMRLIKDSWQNIAKAIIPIGVMGGSSRTALTHHGIGLESSPTPIIFPRNNEQWDSAGLWQELQLLHSNWAGRRVVIFKGDGGRDWLADTLKAAGATVNGVSVYARIPLNPESPAWASITHIDMKQSLWLLTSSEAVRNLGTAIQSHVQQDVGVATALCSHQNIAQAAKEIGFGKVLMCDPGDQALIAASRKWLAS
jgi:uroporphyrinogen-III synthase